MTFLKLPPSCMCTVQSSHFMYFTYISSGVQPRHFTQANSTSTMRSCPLLQTHSVALTPCQLADQSAVSRCRVGVCCVCWTSAAGSPCQLRPGVLGWALSKLCAWPAVLIRFCRQGEPQGAWKAGGRSGHWPLPFCL